MENLTKIGMGIVFTGIAAAALGTAPLSLSFLGLIAAGQAIVQVPALAGRCRRILDNDEEGASHVSKKILNRNGSDKISNQSDEILDVESQPESVRTISIDELRAFGANSIDLNHFKLDASMSNITDQELESIVKRFPNITELDASGCKLLTDEGCKHLSSLKNLTKLDLSHSEIRNAGLVSIGSLENLSEVDLSGCKISSAGLAPIVSMKNLKRLELFDCRKVKIFDLKRWGIIANKELEIRYNIINN